MPEKLMFQQTTLWNWSVLFKLTEKCILRARTALNPRFWHVDFKCFPRCSVLGHDGPPTKSLMNTVILGRTRENKNKLLPNRGCSSFPPCLEVHSLCMPGGCSQKRPSDPGVARWVLAPKREYSARAASGPSLQS